MRKLCVMSSALALLLLTQTAGATEVFARYIPKGAVRAVAEVSENGGTVRCVRIRDSIRCCRRSGP